MSGPKKDYYEILGVEKNANESTIKNAFYKLAKKWHPDRNKDNNNKEESEKKMRDITEAYGVLSDAEKRQKYDDYGLCDGETPDFPQGFPDISEILRAMGGMNGMSGMSGMSEMDGIGGMGGFPFGGIGGIGGIGGMGRKPQRGERIKPVQEVRVKLKMKDIFNGINKNIDILVHDRCGSCNGSGSKNKLKTICSGCKGCGIKTVVRQIGPGMLSQQQSSCDMCEGRGKYVETKDKCYNCKGIGTCETKLNKTIEIHKNFDYETVMLLKNSGNYDQDSETKADINIKFTISDINDYNMILKNSYDLLIEYPINIYDAFTGYSMYWDLHPDCNKYHFKFNGVIKDGDVKFIKKLGLPNKDNGTNKRGNLYIKFKYIYPDNILNTNNYETFIKTRDNKNINNINNKGNYIEEKVYDINDDNKSNANYHNHNHNQNQNHNHNQEYIDEPQLQGCTQS